MASYYYLISSLPMLTSDSEMPFSYEHFLELCSSFVTEEQMNRFKDLTVRVKDGPLFKEWHEFYESFDEELTYERSVRLSKPCEPPLYHNEVVTKMVQDLLKMDNPLEAEKKLLSMEFSKLDELIGTHSFDEYALNGYALKLKLLERLRAFDLERGKEEFDRLFNGIQDQINNI